MKHFGYILLFLTACSTATQENKKEEIKIEKIELDSVVVVEKKAVIDIHNIAMEKMGEMIKLKTALKGELNNLDTIAQQPFIKAIEDLESADQLMWDWMHSYKAKIVDTSSTEEALKYLKLEKIKIDIVAEKIESSLKNGNELLQK